MRRSLLLSTFIATVALTAIPAAALSLGSTSGDCEGNPDGCGPPPPPLPLPDIPAPLTTTGYSWVNLNGFQPDFRGIHDGQGRTVYDAATRTYGNNATGTTLTTTKAPLASATADSHSQGQAEGVEGAIALGYSVVLHAADQAAADALSALIAANGSIASVRGNYSTSQSGNALSTVHATASGNSGFANHVFAAGCDGSGLTCGGGSFSLALGFTSATAFLNGDPLDFIGGISLEADSFAGRTAYTDRFSTAAGTAFAFIDPLITLDPALAGSFTLTIGGGQVVNATPGVPEPATWVMLLTGFGFAGAALRRRPTVVRA